MLAALVVAVAGCGEEDTGPDFTLRTPPIPSVTVAPLATPTPAPGEPRMTAEDAERLRPVIEGWAEAVRNRRFGRASAYFALPVIIYQPGAGAAVELQDGVALRAFNASFPCGAKLVATRAEGRYIVGTFELTTIRGRTCDSPSELVRVGFVFGNRKQPRRFTEWWQVTDDPGAQPGPPARPTPAATKTP